MYNNKTKAKLENISIELFSRYLQAKGWSNPSQLAQASLWNNPENTDGISLPLTKEVPSYERHMWNALRDLSDIEQRNIEQIMDDILAHYEDKVYIRVQDQTVQNGTIPLLDGVILFEKAKNFIHAIALSAKAPKAVYSSTSGGKSVKEFIENVRLGQTQIGSYVIELSYPVQNIQSEQLENEALSCAFSFSRGVTHNLLKSIRKLKESLNQYQNDPSIFAPLVTDGVSYNLCEAITGLSGSNQQREVEISVEAGEIIDHNLEKHFSIHFKPQEIEIINIAAKYYQEEFTLPNADILGKIVSVNSTHLEQGGFIIVNTSIQEKKKDIRVNLTPEQYQIAIQAHADNKTVRCIGSNLHINKKKGRLQTLSTFHIL